MILAYFNQITISNQLPYPTEHANADVYSRASRFVPFYREVFTHQNKNKLAINLRSCILDLYSFIIFPD